MAGDGIMVAVGAIIEDDEGRLLLVRHTRERGGFWQGKWICPGGRLERGEAISDGIKREVLEETNLEVQLLRPLIPFERIVTEEGETTLHVIYIDYVAQKVAGALRPGSDVGEARWVAKEGLSALWGELHEDTQRLLRIADVIPERGEP